MNSPSPDCNTPGKKKECPQPLHFGKHRVQHWAFYLTLGAITAVLAVLFLTLNSSFQVRQLSPVAPIQSLEKPVLASKKHRAADYLISKLKQYGLWKIQSSREVPRFFIESYPPDLENIEDIAVRKRVFLNALLPHALLVRQEAMRKRSRLEAILGKINCSQEDINFDTGLDSENQCSWSDYLDADEIDFIENLCMNYRATTAEGLLERVDAVPTSIILAQGALESSWGSSRFTREGNSIFGMWTWKAEGIVPARRDEGKTHKVRVYDTVLDSVRAYQLTLNRLDPYEEFRQLRRQTDNPLIIAEGLTFYSERGEAYVEDIKSVILSNDLQKYDSYRLSDLDLPEFSESDGPTTPVAETGKASL
jgi:Bax protein